MAEKTHYGQLMITYRCSAACRHCLVMAAPGQEPTLTRIEDAVQYALDFQKLDRRIIIAGGEALLFFDHVLAMCRAICDAGVPIYFIESNGSWCTSDELVTERLSLLRDAGLQGMYFSIDAYHQEFIRAERVFRGVCIARELFGDAHVFAPRTTLEQAKEFESVTKDPERLRKYVRAGRATHFGRAGDGLAPFVDPVSLDDLMTQNCREALDVDNLGETLVDPFGYVRPDMCPGVNLGNTKCDRLCKLSTTKRVRETPLLAEVAERGPAVLLELAQRSGFSPRTGYSSKCHLCFESRRHLVRQMPEEFGPRHLYEIVRG
ncbi:MAG: radical SAM protein [Planctomycetota bacterium]|nr:radical SAM protein [Planctomycetota bacterium]